MNAVKPELVSFLFEEKPVRVVTRDESPWFVAADVCRCLTLTSVTKALLCLDDDEKALNSIQGLSRGNEQANIISESGLYTLILRSRKATTPGTPQHRFRKWVTSVVLPQIRRTGQYQHPTGQEAPRLKPLQPDVVPIAFASRSECSELRIDPNNLDQIHGLLSAVPDLYLMDIAFFANFLLHKKVGPAMPYSRITDHDIRERDAFLAARRIDA